MKTLTTRQQEVLEFLRNFIAQFGYAPAYEEMRIGLGYATKSAVAYQVTKLEEAGQITRHKKGHRYGQISPELRTAS